MSAGGVLAESGHLAHQGRPGLGQPGRSLGWGADSTGPLVLATDRNKPRKAGGAGGADTHHQAAG